MGKVFFWRARYTVLSVLFVAWIVSFMDRVAISVAIPYIAADFHLGPLAMGIVMSAFFATYSLSQVPGGILADRYGVRRVATSAMLWWSAFTAITGSVANVTQMLIARSAFGLGEGVFPACAFKTVAVWFPRRERTTASAIMFAANSLGAALAPLVVVRIIAAWGWRTVFYTLFLPGLGIALLFWFFVPDSPGNNKSITPTELEEIQGRKMSNAAAERPEIDIVGTLRSPTILKYFLILFAFDLTYWGFVTWLPTYLVKARGLSISQMGLIASFPFFAGAIGCVFGGWLSDRFFEDHRRAPVIGCQLIVAALLYLTFNASSETMLVVWQTIAGFFLTLFFAVFWAMPMNSVSETNMGATSGLINMAGQLAAVIAPMLIGFLVTVTNGGFALTFGFLIGALLMSCAIVFILPDKFDHQPD
jgi:sugar phosphate permease